MDFSGVILSSRKLKGEFKPNGIPPNSGCDIWWANVLGSKEG
jgi:hypothetical protein